jgi:ABC-type multidrug transport system fused ATPase/permease subunit
MGSIVETRPGGNLPVRVLGAIAAALVASRVGAALGQFTHHLASLRCDAAIQQARMEGVLALPGLAHLDGDEMPDLHLTAGAARDARMLLSELGYGLFHWWTAAIGSALVLGRWIGWWAPVVVIAAVAPLGILRWRRVGVETALETANAGDRRHADYAASLAIDADAGREVRLFGLRGWLGDRQRRYWSSAMEPVFDEHRRQFTSEAVLTALMSAATVLVLIIAARRLDAGALSLGGFAASVIALTGMDGLGFAVDMPAGLRRSTRFLPALHRLTNLADNEPLLDKAGTGVPPDKVGSEFRFEGVTFTYPGAAAPVLRGLDLVVRPGTSLALVGSNGAGKSTIIKLLCRFYDPDEGRITVDGTDIRSFDLDQWRRRLAVMFQDLTKLPMSIADNVGVGAIAERNQEMLDAAAADAVLTDLVEGLPEKWNTLLAREFGGVDLSGGEWQRVGLARVMTAKRGRDTPILVLDEPTAALDVAVEHDLFQRFADLTHGRTTLLVSHRLSTVRAADAVAVLEDGHIVEHDTHDNLVALGGVYAELWRLQAQRFKDAEPA